MATHRVVHDVPYAGEHPKQKLDLYIPEPSVPHISPDAGGGGASDTPAPAPEGDKPRPIMVFIHGGGWQRGDRKFRFGMYQNVGRAYAEAGFMTAVISYRLSAPGTPFIMLTWGLACTLATTLLKLAVDAAAWTWAPMAAWPFLVAFRRSRTRGNAVKHPTHAEDCAAAVAWVVKHAADYGGDPGTVFLSGHSAGGHLASLLGTDHKYLRRAGVNPSVARGVVVVSGVVDGEQFGRNAFFRKMYLETAFGSDPTIYTTAFPAHHVRGSTPPHLFFNANLDWGLEKHARALCDTLRAARVPAGHLRVPGTHHGSIISSITGADHVIIRESIGFTLAVLGGTADTFVPRLEKRLE